MKKGIYKDLSNEDYHSNMTHRSSSVLKVALEDPVEYRRVYVEGGTPKPFGNQNALDFGNYMHTWLLEPDKLEEECAVYPARQRRGKAWEHFAHQNEGKYIITQPQLEVAEAIKKEFDSSEIQLDEGKVPANTIFTGGEPELSLFIDLEFPLNKSNQEKFGKETATYPVKVRADYIIDRGDHFILRDLKTTSKTPNDTKSAKQICYDYYYFLSAALYLDAFCQHYSKPGHFEFVFASKMDYKTNHYRTGERSLNYGRGQYIAALNNIYYWEQTGDFPKGLIRCI